MNHVAVTKCCDCLKQTTGKYTISKLIISYFDIQSCKTGIYCFTQSLFQLHIQKCSKAMHIQKLSENVCFCLSLKTLFGRQWCLVNHSQGKIIQ